MEITQTQVNDFMLAFTEWGYRDVERALEVFTEAKKDSEALVEAVRSFSDDTETPLDKVDVCYVAYDTLHQEARSDIERLTGTDICNDSPYDGIYVYGNYMCTGFDGSTEAFQALIELIRGIKEEERTSAIAWLLEEIEGQ